MFKQTTEHAVNLTNAGKTTLVGVGMTTGSGVWAWLGAHNEAIASVCSILGVLIAVAGFIVTVRRGKNESDD